MKKRVLAVLLAVALAIGMLPTALAKGSGGGESSAGSVDHIDIGSRLSATIDGTTYKIPDLTTDDADKVIITAKDASGEEFSSFQRSGVSTSTDSNNNPQIRIEGSFPVGTKDSPIYYTVSITKEVVIDGQAVPVTLSVTIDYWDTNNVCPPLKNNSSWQQGNVIKGSGIDLELSQNSGVLIIKKDVVGITLAEDKTYTFLIAGDNGFEQTVAVTVDSETLTGVAFVAPLPDGTYTVTEDGGEIEGFRLTATEPQTAEIDNNSVSLTFTNTYAADTIEIPVSKVWNDSDNQDGLRPSSVTVNLVDAENKVVDSLTLPVDGKWEGSFTDVPADGTYTVAEDEVAGYTANVTDNGDGSFTITNTHIPETIDITVTKFWNDSGNQDGSRPERITVMLMNGESVVETAEITEAADGTWSHTFKNLDKYSGGKEIEYTVVEAAVAGYDAEITAIDENYTVVITNSHSPAVLEKISVTKVWKDDSNRDGSRPDSVTVRLFANGEPTGDTLTLTAATGWSGAFENLPANKNGKAIVYTVTEDVVPGYATVITGTAASGFTVTNTHIPATVNISGHKYWLDNFDQDGIRPGSVTIRLYANGKYVAKQVVTRASGWNYSFTGRPMFENGEPIVYTITEDPVKGYVTTYTVTPFGYDVTNTHVPAVTAIGGTKVWDDANDQDGKRPDAIVVNLYANGIYITSQVVTEATGWTWGFGPLAKYYDHGKLVIYTVTENAVDGYTTVIKGNKIINSYTPEETSVTVMKVWDDADNQDGIRASDITVRLLADGKDTGRTAVLSDGNGWIASFTGLDKYRDGGIEIVYTVEETEVPVGYEVSYSADADGIKVVNTHIPETIDISGSKTWDDNDNQDGMRPEYITIRLYADGEEIDSRTVTEGDGWSWSFEDLPVYKAGVEIVYAITEDAVENYTGAVDGYDVTNTHAPGKTDVNVIKAWSDKNNQDGIRPESVTVRLYANGEDTGKTLILTAEDGWTGSFAGLDEYANGQKIDYTVTEDAVEGYEAVITGDAVTGFTIDNVHTPATVAVTGSKTWDDADNQDGKRPDSITVNLLANGVEIDEAVVTAEDGWTYSFEDLPKFESGAEIIYAITEDVVEGYTVTVDGYDLVNSYVPGKTSVTVTKAWSDSNDKDGLRPDSVTIRLLANGVDTGKTLVLTADGKWTGTFADLDEYADGEKIVYTIEEDVVKGYNAVISGDAATGFIVTNSHTATPKTGDSAMPFLMGGIGAAALVLFLGLLLAKRKKEEY